MVYSFCLESESHLVKKARAQKELSVLILACRFFKTIAGFAYNIPVIGPYLSRALQVAGDKAGANERAHKDLPV